MDNNKKYKIITSIEDDAPYGNINWCAISFLTPQKIKDLEIINVKGFKVHGGYNTIDIASDDAKKIKSKNKNHDVYLSQLGKMYSWDDTSKADSIEYENDKLNTLERTRRENADKVKLMKEQFKNEYNNNNINPDNYRADKIRERIRKKFYEKGKITKKELDSMQETNKIVKNDEETKLKLEKLKNEIDQCLDVDFLDENDPIGLKHGCITIYSPEHIGGLKTLCFKIRGLFQTKKELDRRVKYLEKEYPGDRIYSFEVGKWCPISENDDISPSDLQKQLNYSMKCYLNNLEHEKDEFQKRKEELQTETEQESKIIKEKKRKQKKSAQQKEQEKSKTINHQQKSDLDLLGNDSDNVAIRNIFNHISDPELHNRFPSNTNTMELNVN
jgi:hypothetical protein